MNIEDEYPTKYDTNLSPVTLSSLWRFSICNDKAVPPTSVKGLIHSNLEIASNTFPVCGAIFLHINAAKIKRKSECSK